MIKTKVMATIFIALILASLGQGIVKAQIPEVELSETTISPNDTVYVYGSGFDPNTTVRIDIYLPSGTTLEGVAYNETDENGTFNASFIAPDSPAGSGYVKVVSGNLTISKYVFFEGSVEYRIDVEIPDEIYANEYTNITVEAPFMNGNKIVDITLIQPDSSILTLYYVLHEGYANMPIKFKWEGTYHLFLQIEDTPYNYTDDLYVHRSTDNGDDDGDDDNDIPTPPTETVKWMISNSLNNYRVSIMIGNETMMSGEIYLYTPIGDSQTLQIEHGVATFIADSIGTYSIQFIKDKKLYERSVIFNPNLDLKTDVDETGLITILFTADGQPLSANAKIYENGIKKASVSLENGVGTYSLPESGSYTIKVFMYNKSAISTISYQEEPVIDNIYLDYSDGTLWIMGTVLGKYSDNPIEDRTVSLEITGIGTVYAHTDGMGKFMESVPIPVEKQGQTIYVSATIGDYQKTLSIKTDKDFIHAYGLWILLLALIITGIAWKKGYLDFLKKPPQGRTKKAVTGRRFKLGG